MEYQDASKLATRFMKWRMTNHEWGMRPPAGKSSAGGFEFVDRAEVMVVVLGDEET